MEAQSLCMSEKSCTPPYDLARKRPKSQEQLVAEVKSIYAGLVMIEAKCIEVDNRQAALAQGAEYHLKLNNEQWQSLIALHRILLHEHHDFFLASRHPSASPALRSLASKYISSAGIWRHGIDSFRQLLRHWLRKSPDRMPTSIYLAYSMTGLLYEAVSRLEDTSIRCLGDLGRYRMAIEDDDISDREVWTDVARHWYSKTPDKTPTTSRLYHHVAILTRPNALMQLYYYTKSLCVAVPFISARESIATSFEPVLNDNIGNWQYRQPVCDAAFAKAHGILFTERNVERFGPAVPELTELLFNHATLVFLYWICHNPEAMDHITTQFPWELCACFLNTLLSSHQHFHRIEVDAVFPQCDDRRPFAEDYALRGLQWSDDYYPNVWFKDENIGEDETYHELAYVDGQRKYSKSWLEHLVDSPARSVASSFLGLLQTKALRSMILLGQLLRSFQVAAAFPISALPESRSKSESGGFINYFVGQWHQLRDHLSGPMAENTGYACVLAGMYYALTRCDEGWWKGTNLLEIVTAATSSYSYFLGNEEWLSDPQVLMVASLNIRLNVKVLQQKLSAFPKTQMPTVFVIGSASVGSAGMLAKYMPAPGGRYQNPWVQAAMLLPLTNLFFTAFWVIFIRNPGVAKRLEEEALFSATVESFRRRLPAILASALILVLLTKV